MNEFDNTKKRQKRKKRLESLNKELEECKDEDKKKKLEKEISELNKFTELKNSHLICKKCQNFYPLKEVEDFVTETMKKYSEAVSNHIKKSPNSKDLSIVLLYIIYRDF